MPCRTLGTAFITRFQIRKEDVTTKQHCFANLADVKRKVGGLLVSPDSDQD